MNTVVADTHAIVWYLSDRSKLSAPALAALPPSSTGKS